MALFTVFSYKRRPPTAIAALMDALTAAAHVQPSHVVRASLSGVRRPVHAHVLSTATAVYAAEQQVDLGAGLTVVHGHPFRPAPDGGPQGALTAAEAARDCAGGVDLAEVDRWAGDFALCHVDSDGVLTALSDLHRVQSVFYVDLPWMFAVSTRPSLLRLLAGNPGFDPEALAAVTATGYAFGEATIHAGVRAVPQGLALRWDGDGVQLLPRDRVVSHPAERELDIDDAWTRGQLDDGIEQAGASLELASAAGRDDVELGITGGKDSRVVLALALARGLRPRLVTRGSADHPDVVVGRMVAERTGLPHRVVAPTPSPAGAPALPSAEAYLGGLARHAFLTDGLVGGWDLFTGTRTGTEVSLTGLMGEILKAYSKQPLSSETRPDAATIVALQSPFDPMDVLTPWGRSATTEGLDRRFVELLQAGYAVADLPDLYYYEHRIPNWLGHSKQVHTFTTTSIAPLGSVPLARLALGASARQRRAELLPYLIVRRAAPELLDLPFAMQTWDPALPGAPRVDPVELPAPTGSAPPVRANGTWQFALWKRPVREAVIDLVLGLESDAAWQAVDRQQLLDQLTGPPLGIRKIMSLLGFLPLAMFLDGKVDETKIVSPEQPAQGVPYAFTPAVPGPAWHLRGRGASGASGGSGGSGSGWQPV